jgi:xylan 1,4-beta-xylosidase
VKPQPYRHQWSPERPYNSIYTGWAHPPRDYAKWAGLLQAWVRHCIERYGRQEVASWYWEIWNEPDIGYWQSTTEEYLRLYDYSADAIKRVLPEIRIGGPTTTGPGSPKAAQFLRDFLEHAARGRNYATGRTGSPLDYITFHAKGRPKVVDGHVQMGSEFQLRDIDRGFAIVASFPEWKHLPIILGESDPEGCAACSVRFHPQNAYRNGTMYSSYTAATFAKKYELALRHGIRLEGAVTWAFEFEGQPYFDGFRDLATNGIAKPVLNVFRMFGLMSGERVQAESTGSVALDAMLASGARQAHVLLWHYHDDDVAGPPAEVSVDVKGFSPGVDRILLEHFRVDENYSNAYTAWLAMGSPQSPTPEQHSKLERAGLLESISPPSWRPAQDGSVRLQFPLPRQAVSLLRLSW